MASLAVPLGYPHVKDSGTEGAASLRWDDPNGYDSWDGLNH